MQPGLRPFIGTIVLVAFIVVYVLAAMVFASVMLPNAGGVAQFVFYAIAGLAWVPVAGLILSWMYPKRRAGS
jgi:Protein of unknown function (DUF2842)